MARETGTVRQERALRTREAILDAAAEVFDAHGYAGAGLAAIIERAGIAKGALYFHFDSKEQLARILIDEQFQLAPSEDSYCEGMQGLIDLTYQVATSIAEQHRVRAAIRLVIEHTSFTSPLADPYLQWMRIVSRFLAAASGRGQLRHGVDPDRAAWLIVSCFTGVQLVSEVLTGRCDLAGRIGDLWANLGPGLVTAAWARRLQWAGRQPAVVS